MSNKDYWRSLEERADSDAFRELVQREFPQRAAEWTDPVTRRQFLTLMGASLALAGLAGCMRPPREKILPYVRQPEQLVLGKPLFYATAMTLGGVAMPLLVESHEGRPTKIEGNPEHPASGGATDAFAQASVLGLYDPDRAQAVTYLGRPRAWNDAFAELRKQTAALRQEQGRGLRILTETVTSPTMGALLTSLLSQMPEAKWHQYEPAGPHSARAGAQLAFGEDVHTVYRLENAKVILGLDADFLTCGPGHLAYVRAFTAGRRVRAESDAMNRLYAVESTPTPTGAVADHRLALRPSQVEAFARAVAAELKVAGVQGAGELPEPARKWVSVVARDLQANRGASAVLAGDGAAPAVHALAHAMNHTLGNVGTTVIHTALLEARPVDQWASLANLVRDMDAGEVKLLLVLGGNPVFTAPRDLHFKDSLERVPLRLHLGLYDDETAKWCQWHVNEAHYLEAWGDARAYDGTVTIQQPLIEPLYGGRTALELVASLTDYPERSAYDLVREHWRGQHQGGDFEAFWQRSLHDGFVKDTQLKPKEVALKEDQAARQKWAFDPGAGRAQPFEIIFRPDPAIHDGRFANNGWLQELPKPLTRLTWDNAAILSPAAARKLGVTNTPGIHGGEHGELWTDMVKLRYRGEELELPAFILPGHPDDAVTVHFGYGRTRAGRVGAGVGADVYRLRTSAAPWFDGGLTVEKTGNRFTLACTQFHHLIDLVGGNPAKDRRLIRAATLEEFRHDPHFAAEEHGEGRRVPLSLYPPEHPSSAPHAGGPQWGMAIDLTACVGCNACVVACQAENNIPVVGKTEVTRGREMHWLRIDTYYAGDPEKPETLQTHFQPLPCMHCENAPCELVCPVEATVHSDDGLNDMVYNRCVGTRYCSNNCPYKVRRFNFFQFTDYTTPSLKLLHNPDVTVRSRGVMEKCTYCVQRIRGAMIEADKESREVRDGEILTACQAVCPAGAIVFGNINDGKSAVRQMKDNPLNYGLLTDLSTRPRTTYLAALRNPNPDLGTA